MKSINTRKCPLCLVKPETRKSIVFKDDYHVKCPSCGSHTARGQQHSVRRAWNKWAVNTPAKPIVRLWDVRKIYVTCCPVCERKLRNLELCYGCGQRIEKVE